MNSMSCWRTSTNGLKIEVGDTLQSLEYVRQAAEVAGFTPALVLEGLHLNRKLKQRPKRRRDAVSELTD